MIKQLLVGLTLVAIVAAFVAYKQASTQAHAQTTTSTPTTSSTNATSTTTTPGAPATGRAVQ